MMNDPKEIQHTQLKMAERVLEPAHGETDNRPRQKVAEINEWPVRLVPVVRVHFGALLNPVNDVVEELRKSKVDVLDTDGNYLNLSLPLSRKNNGIATKSLESLYIYLQDLKLGEYLILGSVETVNERVESLIENITKQMETLFFGEPIEMEGFDFVIDRRDYFKVAVDRQMVTKNNTGKQTVNEVQLLVDVYIHAASLTVSEDTDNLQKSYVTTVRNAARTFDIATEAYVLFDVANFSVRPSLLAFFNAVLGLEAFVSVGAFTNENCKDANTVVRINPNIK